MVIDSRAQISVEMIIVLAAIIVVVLLFASKLFTTSENAAKKLDEKTSDVLKKIDKFGSNVD